MRGGNPRGSLRVLRRAVLPLSRGGDPVALLLFQQLADDRLGFRARALDDVGDVDRRAAALVLRVQVRAL